MPGIEIKGRSKIATYRHGGRISKQLGGVGNTQPITGTQRFDQSRGYYQPDMGMRAELCIIKVAVLVLKKAVEYLARKERNSYEKETGL